MLDRLRRLSYIGAWALVAGCRPPRPERLVPVSLPPLPPDSGAAWARATLPARPTSIRFRWRYQDEQVRYAGRGAARIAPPDSLRFDYVGPLGFGAGAAVVIGDSVAWAKPARDFRTLIPAIPMLWAGLGIVRPPGHGVAVFGRADSSGNPGARRIWRLVQASDTLDYVLTAAEGAGRVLEAEWRRAGVVVARSATRYQHERPVGARIDFPEGPARFELTVVEVDTAAVIPPTLWGGRR